MTGRGENHAGEAVSMHRSEKLLCNRGMRCPGLGPYEDQSGSGRSYQVGKYDLPGYFTFHEGTGRQEPVPDQEYPR